MKDSLIARLHCPICKSSLRAEGNSLLCAAPRAHCFDIAGAGYVNLAPAKAAGGGDDAELIRARTAFLNGGYYDNISDTVLALLKKHAKGNAILDAGCGEGYYSCRFARGGMDVIGLDLSKRGITHAAKNAKREALSALFCVGGIFDLPLADASVDAVVSLFAPVAETEFLRVLKPGGVLVLVGAGADHLYSLKRVLYDSPYKNEARADAPVGMNLLEHVHLSYLAELDAAALQSLFAMTPYYYRTSKEGRARLDATEALSVEVDVDIDVYEK
jgi:23S rRNA (guanine745-N1)-methyltransferase